MSNQSHQRGRKVSPARSQGLNAFYWIIGLVAVVGVAVVVATAMGGGDEATTATSALDPTSTLPPDVPVEALSSTEPPFTSDGPVPSGTTPEGFYYKGNPDAPVTVVEYSDFQCPACAHHTKTLLPRLYQQYISSGDVRLIFHDFPLQQHPNALRASAAARCAGEQGKFWEMEHALFEHQDTWSNNPATSVFASLAEPYDIDTEAFAVCLDSGKYTEPLNAARLSSQQAGINATPTFVVNGKQIEINQLFSEIEAALQAQE